MLYMLPLVIGLHSRAQPWLTCSWSSQQTCQHGLGEGFPRPYLRLKSFRELRATEEEPTFFRGMTAGKWTMLQCKVLQPCTKDNSKLKNKSHESVRGICYVGCLEGWGKKGRYDQDVSYAGMKL